ncbi:MAG TPA: peptidase S10 [Terriglobales bacterium]|nr:peptidase S10 [Terriglobales bacterium]
MRTLLLSFLLAWMLAAAQGVAAQQKKPEATPAAKPAEKAPAAEEPARATAPKEPPATAEKPEAGKPKELKWDMTEAPASVTHHSLRLRGKTLNYTATAGRLPIKDPTGKIEAEMFYVAYTLDGAERSQRPLTFAFNGGPGSASIWLHMGALGPRKVVLEPEGWMPASPYRLMDNPDTPLDQTDLVLVDAIGTGFSRPADLETGKKFWGVKGDAEAFGEFIRLYITRNQRWSSPLYLLGESYGTTRSAAVAGYLIDRGIAFNGIILLSTVLDFETLATSRRNDEAYILTLPSFTMIAAYHKKLVPELMQDAAQTRAEVEKWASTEYTAALAKGDALTPEERQAVIAQLARYTGLKPELIDEANLRIDVRTFTHNLLAEQKLRVGRLDGRYTGPDPEGFLETQNYDPTGANTGPPFTAVFNDYVRRELNYQTDMPYYTSAGQLASSTEQPFFQRWEWGPAIQGFPDTSSALRAAMVKDRHLKVLVMEGYYDLATPFWAADYTMNHLDLAPEYRKNLSFAHYDSGHMVYLRSESLTQFHNDVDSFISSTTKP